jgi:hypothetical protein
MSDMGWLARRFWLVGWDWCEERKVPGSSSTTC